MDFVTFLFWAGVVLLFMTGRLARKQCCRPKNKRGRRWTKSL